MVTQTDILAEVAEAEANGLRAEDLVEIEQAIDGGGMPLSAERVRLRNGQVADQGFTYTVAPSDAAQWIPAWRMEMGRDGLDYGRPTKLNKSQLGLHLSRRRPDGGRLFVIAMPERVVPLGRFQCFVLPNDCQKRLSTKGMLLDHIEGFHPTAARHYAEDLEVIRKSMNAENTARRRTIEAIAQMSDDPWVQAPAEMRAASQAAIADVDVSAGSETPTEMTKPEFNCQFEGCGWTPKAGSLRPDTALRMHIYAKHQEVG